MSACLLHTRTYVLYRTTRCTSTTLHKFVSQSVTGIPRNLMAIRRVRGHLGCASFGHPKALANSIGATATRGAG